MGDDINMNEMGTFIKEKREQANYSQQRLAKKCGLGYDSTISNIENGSRSVKCEEICQIFKVLKNFSLCEAFIEAGYLSKSDVSLADTLYKINELTESEIKEVESFIEFLLYKRNSGKKEV